MPTYPQDVGDPVDIYPFGYYIWGLLSRVGEARHEACLRSSVALLTLGA